jgi:hypothetical protein
VRGGSQSSPHRRCRGTLEGDGGFEPRSGGRWRGDAPFASFTVMKPWSCFLQLSAFVTDSIKEQAMAGSPQVRSDCGAAYRGIGCSKWKRYVFGGDRRRRGSQAANFIFGRERENRHAAGKRAAAGRRSSQEAGGGGLVRPKEELTGLDDSSGIKNIDD